MNYNFKKINFIIISIVLMGLLNSCVLWDPADARKISPNSKERVKKNLEEGKGMSLGKLMKGGTGGTNYQFASSNPMWRATLEILDFLPLTTVDYSGGIIITDWYSDSTNGESIKITVRFLSNEIRSDSLKIIIHNKNCQVNENCKIVISNSKIKEEIQRSILTKAMQFKENARNKK